MEYCMFYTGSRWNTACATPEVQGTLHVLNRKYREHCVSYTGSRGNTACASPEVHGTLHVLNRKYMEHCMCYTGSRLRTMCELQWKNARQNSVNTDFCSTRLYWIHPMLPLYKVDTNALVNAQLRLHVESNPHQSFDFLLNLIFHCTVQL